MTPRNLAVVVAGVAALFAALGGLAGYKFGQSSPTPIVIQVPAPTAQAK
ncbi:MAG TPA: hypothetical protein VGH47_04320 [Xanthobacteraceae bacterium]|jgi:hypothetical protein